MVSADRGESRSLSDNEGSNVFGPPVRRGRFHGELQAKLIRKLIAVSPSRRTTEKNITAAYDGPEEDVVTIAFIM